MKRILSILFTILLLQIPLITASAESLQTSSGKLVTNGDTTFIIESNGSVIGWGENTFGEVGIGSTDNQLTPVNIEGLSNIKDIIPNVYGHGHFFAIDKDGKVYGWGYNRYNQLGVSGSTKVPIKIPNLPPIKKIVLGDYTTYAITVDGDVYSAGRNNNGQVGNGNTRTQMTFIKINQLSNIRNIITKTNTVYAITEDNNVYSWGRGNDWQLGIGVYSYYHTTPTQITDLNNLNVDKIVTNGSTTFAVCNDGQEVYSWGAGWSGQAGNNHEDARKPVRVWILSDLDASIDTLVIKGTTAFALTSDNNLYGWGENGTNQLGQGGTFDKRTPIIIPELPEIEKIVFNGNTGFALGTDKHIYVWGTNSRGEAGIGRSGRISSPIKLGLSNIEEIYNAGFSTFARDIYGNIYSWGINDEGQLGLDNTTLTMTPTAMTTESNLTEIILADDTAYAIDSDNTIHGWGENRFGELANETTINEYAPIIVTHGTLTTTNGIGSVEGVIPIIGTINPLTVSITHPLNVSYSINPNIENSFICNDINILNNSKVPVEVHIESFESSQDGELIFQDVLPESYDWNSLNKQQSKSLIALGIQYTDATKWYNSQTIFSKPVYAVDIDNTYVGSLGKGASCGFKLCASHGLAFVKDYTAKHDLVFVFTLK